MAKYGAPPRLAPIQQEPLYAPGKDSDTRSTPGAKRSGTARSPTREAKGAVRDERRIGVVVVDKGEEEKEKVMQKMVSSPNYFGSSKSLHDIASSIHAMGGLAHVRHDQAVHPNVTHKGRFMGTLKARRKLRKRAGKATDRLEQEAFEKRKMAKLQKAAENADKFKAVLKAMEQTAKLNALDNLSCKSTSLRMVTTAALKNRIFVEVAVCPMLLFSVCLFLCGFAASCISKADFAADSIILSFFKGMDDVNWDSLLLGGMSFNFFLLVWYLGRIYARREEARIGMGGMSGTMQTISVVARSSGMSFSNSVQLWRYMCCVNVFAVSGIGSGSIYSNSNFAESMINLWHLLTPQEMEMLEVLRPNTSYAHKEFCVYCAEVCTNSLQHGELDPRTYDRLISLICTLRSMASGPSTIHGREPPFAVRQMASFAVFFYVCFLAFCKGINAGAEMILTTPSLERGTSTEYYTPCSDFPDFNDEWAGSRATSATYNLGTSVAWGGDGRGLGKTSSATYSYSDGTCTGVTVTTSFEDYSVYWFSIFMAFFQYFIVSFLYIGLLDLCDALRDCYGKGPLSIDMAGKVNSNLRLTRLIVFFDEVFKFYPEQNRLGKDAIGDEVLDQMYAKGVLDPAANEHKWRLDSNENKWRSTALHALTKKFESVGIEGVKTIFEAADKDGSGELEVAEIGQIFRQEDPNFPEDQLFEIMQKLDPDRSGAVTWDEFYHVVCSGSIVNEFTNMFHNSDAQISFENMKAQTDVAASNVLEDAGSSRRKGSVFGSGAKIMNSATTDGMNLFGAFSQTAAQRLKEYEKKEKDSSQKQSDLFSFANRMAH